MLTNLKGSNAVEAPAWLVVLFRMVVYSGKADLRIAVLYLIMT